MVSVSAAKLGPNTTRITLNSTYFLPGNYRMICLGEDYEVIPFSIYILPILLALNLKLYGLIYIFLIMLIKINFKVSLLHLKHTIKAIEPLQII